MTLTRRRDQTTADKKGSTEVNNHDDDDNNNDHLSRTNSNTRASGVVQSIRFILMAYSAFVAAIGLAIGATYWVPKLWVLRVATLLPIGVAAWLAFQRNQRRNIEQRLLPLTLVATTIFAQLPAFFGFTVAAGCIVLFSLSTLPVKSCQPPFLRIVTPARSRMEKGSPLTVLYSVLLLVAILLTENFMVWVVSATFPEGQTPATSPPPLQDNGQYIVRVLMDGLKKSQVVGLRRLWNVQGALVACLGTSFVLAEVFGKRQLYALGTRAVLTLAAARTIRTISFLVTVLPSQNKFCYKQHFPYPPPTDWMEWIWVGLLPSKFGGCNDLIISGHATVTSTLACVATSMSSDPIFCIVLWTMVALDYMVEIFEGFHYSVDMWLGVVLVCLLWRVLQPVEAFRSSETAAEQEGSSEANDIPGGLVVRWKLTVLAYSALALVALLQMTVLPSWTVNFLILIYTISTAVLYLGFSVPNKNPATAALYQHTAQHTLYCLLFMALGVYL